MNFKKIIKRANPFHGIIETKSHPHARTMRTDFITKMFDTGSVFAGNKHHVGLFDYATFFLSFLSQSLWKWCWHDVLNSDHHEEQRIGGSEIILAILAVLPIGAVNLCFAALRYVSAGILALAAAPVVGVVHAIGYYWFGKQHRDNILNSDFFSTHSLIKSDIRECIISPLAVVKQNDLSFSLKANITFHLKNHEEKNMELDVGTENHGKIYRAILNLNLWNASRNFDKKCDNNKNKPSNPSEPVTESSAEKKC